MDHQALHTNSCNLKDRTDACPFFFSSLQPVYARLLGKVQKNTNYHKYFSNNTKNIIFAAFFKNFVYKYSPKNLVAS